MKADIVKDIQEGKIIEKACKGIEGSQRRIYLVTEYMNDDDLTEVAFLLFYLNRPTVVHCQAPYTRL